MAAPTVKSVRFAGLLKRLIGRQNLTGRVGLHRSSAMMGEIDDKFSAAKERLNTLKEAPDNMVKLQIYALFKQASVGKCNVAKPGMMDFVGKAKWDAWNGLGDISQDAAKQKYIDLVQGLAAQEAPAETPGGGSGDAGKYKTISVNKDGGQFRITLNRPTKKNAINFEMYEEIGQALREADADDSVVLAVMTGAGDYYCSGNDLGNLASVAPQDIPKMAVEGGDILERFVNSFIDFQKPLIALINGPAVGVSVTVLGLYDVVYATDKATFQTPFSALGQSPEGCSSYIFPRLMGGAKASEMLLFNKKITAVEAMDRNLVTEVFPDLTFKSETESRVKHYSQLPKQSLRKSKNLTRDQLRDKLKQVNKQECEVLVERWQSQECMTAIMNFFSNKGSKL